MINNDYMSCDFYQNQAKNLNNEGFVTFHDEKTAKYYFAFANPKNNQIVFRSEGYPTVKAQTTGLNSFQKNCLEAKQYSILEEDKSFYVILKAKNSVEIARSCPFKTKAEAEAIIVAFTVKADSKTDTKVSVAPKTAKVVDTKTAKVVVTEKPVETKVVAPKATAVKTPAKVAATKSTTKVTQTVAEKVEAPTVVEEKATAKTATINKTAKVTAPKATAKKVTTSNTFAADEMYLGHPTLETENGSTGFALFTDADAKHYFVVYNFDGSIFQRSVGFDSASTRDNAFNALQAALMNEHAYEVVEQNNAFMVQVKGEKGELLSSSLAFPSYTDAFLRTPKGWSQPQHTIGTMY